jgi:creatinine amidohydrolase/Fe(II)-dependent formamide hydrolase-like protein
VPAHDLDKLTWPEVKAEIDGGRDTVVMALGATEQHGLHMPLATDALLGDHMALAAALELLDADERASVVAVTDLSVLLQIAQLGESEHGVPLADGGLHAGEWETSLLRALHPELVKMESAEAGFTGDLQEAVASMFSGGVASISPNGAIGDPTSASREHGERY